MRKIIGVTITTLLKIFIVLLGLNLILMANLFIFVMIINMNSLFCL